MNESPDNPRPVADTLVDGSIPPGGLVVQSADAEYFVDVAVALHAIATPVVTRVPGTEDPIVGATFVDDEILAVVRAGSAVGGTCLVCNVDGERVVVQGLEVLRIARDDDHLLPKLDVRALVRPRRTDDESADATPDAST